MRKKLIAANWKMYKTPEQAKAFVSAFLPLVEGHTRDEIVLCPPFVSIPTVVEATHGKALTPAPSVPKCFMPWVVRT
jgi:triosephosphate isomerase